MPTQLNEVVQFLRRAALRQEEGGLTDGQLLARFIEQVRQRDVPTVVFEPAGTCLNAVNTFVWEKEGKERHSRPNGRRDGPLQAG